MTTPAIPLDIRLMNGMAGLLLVVAMLAVLGSVLGWAMRLPVFVIHGVTVTGDVAHYNAITLRANVMPRLQGTFFTLDVHAARKAFEGMPWVRQAVVRRDFPDRLRVQLQEHQAVAFWGADDDSHLVNSFGEVFEANVGELEQDKLPRLIGPDNQSAQVLAMQRTLQPLLAKLDLGIDQLELTTRGGWHAQLDNGASLELGSGSTEDLVARTQRFVQTITQATSHYQRSVEQLEAVDLRHPDGYAIQLAGVSTLEGDGLSKAARQGNR
jgi:cell division protein FtsQ